MPRNLEVAISDSVLGTVALSTGQLGAWARSGRVERRLAAIEAMGRTRAGWARAGLAEALSDEWALLRDAAARGLASSGAGLAEGAPTPLALDALGSADALPAPEVLRGYLGSPDLAIRYSAVGAMGRLGGAQHLALLHSLMGQEQELAVRLAAIRAICAILVRGVPNPPAELSGLLLALAEDPLPAVRAEAISVLGVVDPGCSRSALLAALDDPEPLIRCRALRALGEVGVAEDLAAMRRLLDDAGGFDGCVVAEAAKRAVRRLRWRSVRQAIAEWLPARGAADGDAGKELGSDDAE